MARRMSNRDRIARAAEEADAAAREQGEEAAPGRMKLVWAVHAPNGSIVATYPYPQRSAAQAEAERLTTADGRAHYVQQAKVPI